jgi:hypothetical protein
VPAGVSDPAWWDTGARAGEIPVPF